MQTDGAPLTDVPRTDVENFDSAAFLARRAENKMAWRWTPDNRYEAILYLLKINGLESASQLTVNHFARSRFDRAYSQKKNPEFHSHSDMIIKTLAHRGIALDPARFKPTMKALKQERDGVLSSVPLYTPPDETGALRRNICDVEAMLPEAPGVVADLITSLGGGCDHASLGLLSPGVTVRSDVFNADHTGVVYVAVVVSPARVIYVGSSTHLWERVKTHKTGGNNGDDREIYKYLVDNNLVIGEGVVIVPIWTGQVGFETLMEAACYDALKVVQDDGGDEPLVNLQNRCRPLKVGVGISTLSFIYEMRENERLLYIGSTNNFYERRVRHIRNCYKDQVGNKLYNHIRSINDTAWPEDLIKMVPIEKVPIYFRYRREKELIEQHDLINCGLNSGNLCVTPSEKKEQSVIYQKQYHEQHREQRLEMHKAYYETHKDELKAYRKEHSQEISARMKTWRANNSEHRANYIEDWRARNAEHVANYTKEYTEKRKHNMTQEEKERISQRSREQYQQKIANMTDEERKKFYEDKRRKHHESRRKQKEALTKEQKEQISKRNSERYQQKMANMTDAERKAFRERQGRLKKERLVHKKAEAVAAASS